MGKYSDLMERRAKRMRNNPTPCEKIMYNRLTSINEHFIFQFIKGNYIADFFLKRKNIILEIDGSSHDGKEDYDANRDAFFRRIGYKIIHIKNCDVETVNLNFLKNKFKKPKRVLSLAQKVQVLKRQTKNQKLKPIFFDRSIPSPNIKSNINTKKINKTIKSYKAYSGRK